MNKKILAVVIGVVIVVGGGAFYGGIKYAQGKQGSGFGNLTAAQRQQFQQAGGANIGGNFRGGAGQGRGGAGGGLTTGEIISKDSQSVTVKVRDGGSKIIFFSDTTEVNKFVQGTSTDLVVGKNISITGTTNSDGSITAQSIQIRPNLPTPTPTP